METKYYEGFALDGPRFGDFIESLYDKYAVVDPDSKLPGTMAESNGPVVSDSIKWLTYQHYGYLSKWSGKAYYYWAIDLNEVLLKIQWWTDFCRNGWLLGIHAGSVKKKKVFPTPHSTTATPEYVAPPSPNAGTGMPDWTPKPQQTIPQWNYRWWFTAPFDYDRYDFFVIRRPEGSYLETQKECFYLNKDAQWVNYKDGTKIEPCLTLSGLMVATLTAAGALREKRENVANILTELVDHIVNNTVQEYLDVPDNGQDPTYFEEPKPKVPVAYEFYFDFNEEHKLYTKFMKSFPSTQDPTKPLVPSKYEALAQCILRRYSDGSFDVVKDRMGIYASKTS